MRYLILLLLCLAGCDWSKEECVDRAEWRLAVENRTASPLSVRIDDFDYGLLDVGEVSAHGPMPDDTVGIYIDGSPTPAFLRDFSSFEEGECAETGRWIMPIRPENLEE